MLWDDRGGPADEPSEVGHHGRRIQVPLYSERGNPIEMASTTCPATRDRRRTQRLAGHILFPQTVTRVHPVKALGHSFVPLGTALRSWPAGGARQDTPGSSYRSRGRMYLNNSGPSRS